MSPITSSGLISVAEQWSTADLVRAGWTQADLEWEARTETAISCAAADDPSGARAAAAEALRIARAGFKDGDPRLGTAVANQAWARAGAGDTRAAEALIEEARRHWSSAGLWIGGLKAPRVARSSLFHMRMEQRHRETYEGRWREEWSKLAEEARRRLSERQQVTPSAALERWRRSRPAMLNDTRKLMAAAILLMLP